MTRAIVVIFLCALVACTSTAPATDLPPPTESPKAALAPPTIDATQSPIAPEPPGSTLEPTPASTPAQTAIPETTPTPTPPAASPSATPNVDPPPPSPAGSVRLMAVGDVMLGWQVGRKIVRKGPASPWKGVKPFFDQADLVVANLECVISDQGEPWPSKLIHLRTPLAAAESLVAGGIDVVSVANNHALDFGPAAFTDTLARLADNEIGYAGGGRNEAAAHAPLIVEENRLRIAFLGYVMPFSSRTTFNTREWAAGPSRPGVAIGTPDAVRRDVSLARESADVVIVMVHGGLEYRAKPNAGQRAFAEAAIEAGAALVLGHHPHVLQGYARHEGTLVAFSLGNFMFARFTGASNDSAILDVMLTPAGVTSLAWIPVVLEGGIPRPAVGPEIQRILSRLPQI